MLFKINRFHLCALVTWQFSIFFGSQMIFPIFSNYTPRWRCGSEGPFTSNCAIYTNCTNIQFEDRTHESAVLEYNWICKDRWKASLFEQMQFLGVLIGTQVFGTLSDTYGRKPFAILALGSGLSVSFISGMVKNWKLLMASRFVVGLSIGGTIVVVCTFIMESLLPEQRMPLRAFFNWGIARLLMTLICWAFPDWRTSTYANAIAALPAFLIVVLIMPESPAWLLSKVRMEDIEKSEKKIAKIAGIPYVKKERKIPEKSRRLLDIIKIPEYRKRLLVLWLMWFSASLCGYGTDLISNRLTGNLYINQCIFSIVIAASKIVLVTYDTLSSSFNRRKLHQYSQAMACVFFFLLSILLDLNYEGILILVISSLGTVFNEYTWDACYLCAVETMPTSMRASSLGSCSLIARLGSLCSPTLSYMASTHLSLPYMVVAVFGIANLIVSCIFLVESKNINLEEVGKEDSVPGQEMTAMLDGDQRAKS